MRPVKSRSFLRGSTYLSTDGSIYLSGIEQRMRAADIKSFHVGLVSMRGERWQLEENYQRLEAYAREAVRRGAEVVVAPEPVLDGFVCGAAPDATRERMLEVAQPVPDGPYLRRAGNLCTELGIYLVFGFLERWNEEFRNSCVMIDPRGQVIARYSKVYPGTEQLITAGREFPAVDTPLGRAGFLICADRVIGANWPPYGAQETQLVFLPMDGGGGPDNTQIMQRHAREHGYWILIANTWSRVLIDASGEVRLEDYTTEGVSIGEVTLSSEPRAEPAKTLDELVKDAFAVNEHRWDRHGRPTSTEVEAREKFRQQLSDVRQQTDQEMASPDYGVGDGLVNLSYSRASDAGLAHLERFSDKLQGLWLRDTQVTDEGLSRLTGLSNLRLLSLHGTRVTDSGMAHLAELPKLRLLDLAGTQVTDAGLAALQNCPDLRWLYLNRHFPFTT